MLEIKKLDKTFYTGTDKKHALDHFDLTINDGDFITVIGSNGSGKSTLMNLIAGVHKPDSGNIILDGQDITKLSNHKKAKYIGRVFQDPLVGTIGDMLVEENMYLASIRGKGISLKWGLSKKNIHSFESLLAPIGLGLEKRMDTRMGDLSGGQRQSITLIMATMNDPKILLLDEHTAALDPGTAKKVMELTNQIVTEKKITTLMITHNMRDAIKYGNRLIMMNNGKIIFEASGKEKEALTVNFLVDKFSKREDVDLPDSLVLS